MVENQGDGNSRHWTCQLIPQIKHLVTRAHGEVNDYLTQLLSGHMHFNKYFLTLYYF